MDGEFLVLQPHDGAVFGFGRDFEAVGESVTLHDEGVVAGCLKRGLDAGEDTFSLVMNKRGLAVHEFAGSDDITAKDLADTLVTEANPEEGNVFSKFPNYIATDSGFSRGAGTGGNTDLRRRFFADFIERDLVVSMHLHLRAQFSEVLDEVVGERVVVVDDEQHRRECIGEPPCGQPEPLLNSGIDSRVGMGKTEEG